MMNVANIEGKNVYAKMAEVDRYYVGTHESL